MIEKIESSPAVKNDDAEKATEQIGYDISLKTTEDDLVKYLVTNRSGFTVQSQTATNKIKELMEYMVRHHDDLLKTMTDEQKDIFEKFEDCWGEYASYAEEAIFEYAFKFGIQIAIEVLEK